MPNASMTIRLAAASDADDVWRLVRGFAPAFRPEREAFDPTFRSLVEASDTLVLVAEESTKSVIGHLFGTSPVHVSCQRTCCLGRGGMVAERARRSGVGQALMIEAESWAESQGAAYMSLASRRAGDFYLALGYEDAATFFKKPLNT